ncbi:sulfatase [Paraglaciecola aquimarina]|uniref:Sulfatase n=1 Tax=Paraglaciecola aquimarina TaxID=1235557 RepID=A0ABU3SRC8_9ALTE|nr:sulfatase [Paraglaciecola aquimarina]MDU0352545.1 sulfatase [Paraglaciecola aquimarina]
MIKNILNAFSKVFNMQKVMTTALCTTVLALTSACSSLSTSADAAVPSVAKETPPNILLILSDDHVWNDYGFKGHEIVKTPALDKLANEGVTFKRAYVPTSLCRPSLATIATGLYASQHGITGNGPSKKVLGGKKGEKYAQLRKQIISKVDKLDTLPELLRAKGYVSHQSGKWWEGSFKRGGFGQGMTQGFGNHPQGRHGDVGLKIGRKGVAPVTNFIDEAVAAGKPFLAWYAPFMPHTPHTPPERILKKYTNKGLALPITKYYAMIEWFDETNGELFDYLEQKGIKDNTLIVYVSDNGWITNPKQTDRFLPLSKQSPAESGVRTPIMFSLPSKFKPQMRPELVSSIDIVPTILGAAGVEVPAGLPGKNLFANMVNETPLDRNEVYGEGFSHDMSDINDIESSLLYRWVIEGDWKLILSYDGVNESYQEHHAVDRQGPRLYKVSTDEHEQVNLAKQHPEIVARLSQKLTDWYPVKQRKILQ